MGDSRAGLRHTERDEMPHDEAVKLARDILDNDRWFLDLDPAFKDELSEPNHNAVMANMGRKLAYEVLRGQR